MGTKERPDSLETLRMGGGCEPAGTRQRRHRKQRLSLPPDEDSSTKEEENSRDEEVDLTLGHHDALDCLDFKEMMIKK